MRPHVAEILFMALNSDLSFGQLVFFIYLRQRKERWKRQERREPGRLITWPGYDNDRRYLTQMPGLCVDTCSLQCDPAVTTGSGRLAGTYSKVFTGFSDGVCGYSVKGGSVLRSSVMWSSSDLRSSGDWLRCVVLTAAVLFGESVVKILRSSLRVLCYQDYIY